MLWGLKKQSLLLMILAVAASAIITGFFLNYSLQLLDSSSVYPMFVAIGALGALLMGATLYGEVLNSKQGFFIALLLLGCTGLFWEGL